jgi:hypothetical protein
MRLAGEERAIAFEYIEKEAKLTSRVVKKPMLGQFGGGWGW